MAAGAHLLEALLEGDQGYRGPQIDCGQGHQAVFVDYRSKHIDTVIGRVELMRACYHCAPCGHGLVPKDEDLGVTGSSLSPGLARMAALRRPSFGQAADMVSELAGIRLNVRRLERAAETAGAFARQAATAEAGAICAGTLIPAPPPAPRPDKLYVEVDGTGEPVRPSETTGRAGKADDGHGPHPGGETRPDLHPVRVRRQRQTGDGSALLHLRAHLRRRRDVHRPGCQAAGSSSASSDSSPLARGASAGEARKPLSATATPAAAIAVMTTRAGR